MPLSVPVEIDRGEYKETVNKPTCPGKIGTDPGTKGTA